MVSFFGLKIGGEKKKKSSKDLQISAPKSRDLDLHDPNAISGNFFDFKGGPAPSYEASVYSLSRQESGQSTLSIASKFKGLKKVAPFASNKFGSSMTDLPTPPSLRHHASNPSIGRRWNTGSSTSLSFAPPSFNPMARPSFKGPLSPSSSMRDDGQPITPVSATPKSPLGQYELKLDLPNDVSSFADFGNFSETVEAPPPLRIKKPASIRRAAGLRTDSQSPQKPPSPPQSIADKETLENPMLEPPPKLPAIEMRPQSAHSHRSIPSGLEELQNAISNFGPTSLPSPSTTPRASEEKPPTAAISPASASPSIKRGSVKPVIQNVRAKRDTLTINPQRRRSLQMRIEAAEGNGIALLSHVDRPKTSSSGRLLERPPPLTLNMGFRLSAADRDGPRSAPFMLHPTRSLTPTSVKSPLRSEVGVQYESSSSLPVNEPSEQHPRPASPSGSSVYDDDDDDTYHHPPSPESTSPVIPLTGPLASPRFPPSSPSPYSYSSAFPFPQKDEVDTDTDHSPTAPPVPPRSLRRNLPTSDSAYWPLPSPVGPSFDRAAMSPSPADSRFRSGSESESISTYEPLDPPRIPASRSESPTFRSFSRPWTPTTSEFTAPPLKRAETAGLLSGLGTGEFGGGLRPPPRSVTVKTPRTEIGPLKNPKTRLGEKNGLGGGFI
ncbi:hypothetical protein ONZ43_g5837 [Nemania bipapillata]|uniref:Uncharacterized protein n=1 Tax=Nemania bipapillata TaxID=110536 RepID=A0ACC2I5U7_9PEZI|nr:hypothetical protein ONZ43_g5837 [Nemania bipapillata]